MTPQEIADDLAVHVTRIYERPDLHLGVLMVLCSPLGFDFPGEGQIRGWLTAIIVGDTGTGKTTVSEGFFNFARIGSRVSGMTASVPASPTAVSTTSAADGGSRPAPCSR